MKPLYGCTHIHNSIQLLVSSVVYINLVSVCKLQNINTADQYLNYTSVSNPVIHSLQLLFNNKTQLQFRSYPLAKNVSAGLSQIKSVTKHQLGDLIFPGAEFFDDRQCSLKGLPTRKNSWFAIIDLKNGCSSPDVILGIMRTARSFNKTFLLGILFYVDNIPSAQGLTGLANDADALLAPLYTFLLPRQYAPVPKQRLCNVSVLTTTAPCTVAISQFPEGTTWRSSLWIHRSPPFSPPPPSYSRHRIHSSSPDYYSNQSVTVISVSRSDAPFGGDSGGGASGSGVMNVEEAFLNRSSVLFVAVSFILLMFISLAWLVFYYVQRFRYLHSKERASRRLAELARKAVARIPLKLLQAGDKEIGGNGEHCAICIEPYRPFDNIRILPCRHYFHKPCIDPWLLEQRSCPMCKLDILQAYDFRSEVDRSCPALTGSDSSTARITAGPSFSPVVVRPDVKTEESIVAVMVNTARDESTVEAVATASVSTSYHDLEYQLEEQSPSPSRPGWFKGVFQSRNRRLRRRSLEVIPAEMDTHRPQLGAHLLHADNYGEVSLHHSSTTIS